MKVTTLMLATAAQTPPDGLFYILGGGVDVVNAPSFPFVQRLSVIGMIYFDPGEEGAHTASLIYRDEDGKILNQLPPMQGDMTDFTRGWHLNIMMDFYIPTPGRYRLELMVDGKTIGAAPITARVAGAVPV